MSLFSITAFADGTKNCKTFDEIIKADKAGYDRVELTADVVFDKSYEFKNLDWIIGDNYNITITAPKITIQKSLVQFIRAKKIIVSKSSLLVCNFEWSNEPVVYLPATYDMVKCDTVLTDDQHFITKDKIDISLVKDTELIPVVFSAEDVLKADKLGFQKVKYTGFLTFDKSYTFKNLKSIDGSGGNKSVCGIIVNNCVLKINTTFDGSFGHMPIELIGKDARIETADTPFTTGYWVWEAYDIANGDEHSANGVGYGYRYIKLDKEKTEYQICYTQDDAIKADKAGYYEVIFPETVVFDKSYEFKNIKRMFIDKLIITAPRIVFPTNLHKYIWLHGDAYRKEGESTKYTSATIFNFSDNVIIKGRNEKFQKGTYKFVDINNRNTELWTKVDKSAFGKSENIKLTETNITLKIGETKDVFASALPEKWNVSKSGIIKTSIYNPGIGVKVTGTKAGTVSLIAVDSNGEKTIAVITVEEK
jgi:hypothetical protein